MVGRPFPAPKFETLPLLILAIVAMLVQQTMATVSKTTLPVLFPGIALELGIEPEWVLAYTWVFASAGMVVMAGCGTVIMRFGAVRTSQVGCLIMGLGLASAATAGANLWLAVPALLLGAVLISAGSTSSTPASSQILARHAPARVAPLVFSIKQSGVPAGVAIASILVVPLGAAIGWSEASLIVAAACLAIALGLEPCRRTFDVDRDPAQKLSFGDLRETIYTVFHHPVLKRLAMAAFAFVGLQAIFTNFTVVYLYEELGYSAVEAGAVLGIGTLVAVPARVFWGIVASALVPPRIVLGLLALVMAAGAAAMGAFSPTWASWQVTAVSVVIGFTALSWHGVLLAEIARVAVRAETGRMTGGVLAFGTAGQLFYPLLFGAALFPFGYAAAYGAIALPAALLGLVLLRTPRTGSARQPAGSD